MVVSPTPEAYINGLSATMLVVTGYLISIKLIASSHHRESKLVVWQALLAFGAGSFYLGTVASFWLLFFTGENIYPRAWGAFLCYTVSPIAVVAAMVIGFSMIKPSWTKPMAIIYGLSAIPFWANLWFDWPESGKTINEPLVAGDLIDIELESLSMIFTTIYILSLIAIVATGFVFLARHSSGEIRTRSIDYALGFYLFGIFGILDTEISIGAGMVAVRLGMVVAYLLLYRAMVPGKEMKNPKQDKTKIETKLNAVQMN